MGQNQLEMKFGGIKMNFKKYWFVNYDPKNVDDEEMTRNFMLLEESLEKTIIECTQRFIQYLKTLKIQNSSVSTLISLINNEYLILKVKYKTPEEIEKEQEEENVKRAFKYRLQQQEQYEQRKRNRKNIFEEQHVRFTLPPPQQNQYANLGRDYNSVGPDYLRNYNQYEYDQNGYDRKLRNYDFDQQEYIKRQRNQEDQYEYNVFNKYKKYDGVGNSEQPKKQTENQPTLDYNVIKRTYEQQNTDFNPSRRTVSQERNTNAQLQRNYSKDRQSQIGQSQNQNENLDQIKAIDQNYQFDEVNQSRMSNMDDPNLSKISLKSKDKYDMKLHYGNVKGDPNEFAEDLKLETKEGEQACSIF